MSGNIELIKYLKISLEKCVSHLYYRGGHLQWNGTQNDTDDGCSIGGEQPLDSGPGNWIFTQKSILKERMQWQALLVTSFIDCFFFLRLLDCNLGNALWTTALQLIPRHHSLAERHGWLHLGVPLINGLLCFEHCCKTRVRLLSVAVLHYHTQLLCRQHK